MNFEDEPEEAAFRARFREWLSGNMPGPVPRSGEESNSAGLVWHRKLYSSGWLGVSWPKEYGGQGLSPVHDAIVNQELGEAGAPPVPSVGYLGRAILHYGTPEQRSEYLPPMLSGEVQWCQGFSEPGAGSDLAALSTRAELRADHYVVNGQKVWTSRAQWADWCLLLCRTQTDVPKHKGISCLVFEMDRPGITVRPVQQIWGTADFCEVFFDDLEVPVTQRIGQEGDGWPLATRILAHERGPSDIAFIAKLSQDILRLQALLPALPERERARFAPRVVEAEVALAACRLHVMRSISLRAKGTPPGPDSSIEKILMTRAEQQIGAIILESAGATPLLDDDTELLYEYFRSRAASIYGGTDQIQKGIVAQRILGMPRP